MIDVEQIAAYCKDKDFDLVGINFKIADMHGLQQCILQVMLDHDLIMKDGYPTYDAIGMQYEDETNPFYDAVQQGAFYANTSQVQCRLNARYKLQNDIGKMVMQYIDLTDHNILLERGRIIKAKPGHHHKNHLDYDIRIHLPIFTNPQSIMVYSGCEYHMPADGSLYLINGFRLHKFYNKGETERIHLAWIVQKELWKISI